MADTGNQLPTPADQPLPGSVVAPGGAPQPSVAPAPVPLSPAPAAPVVPPTPLPAPAPLAPAPLPPAPPAPSEPPPDESPTRLPAVPDEADLPAEVPDQGQNGQSVTWTASEFVAHDKSAGWYLLLGAGAILFAAAIFFLTRDFISVGVVIIAALFLGVYASHQPRQLPYVVDERGVGIGQKYHTYDEFRSFSVASDGAFSTVVFMPLRRFALPLTIYYAPDDEERILDILNDRLPFEEHRQDAVDSLMKRIRF